MSVLNKKRYNPWLS